MDVWGITLATLRRWYVLLPILMVAAVMALAAGRNANPQYEATGTIMLTPPRTSSPIANPLVNAQSASDALAIVLNGPETKAQLEEHGLQGQVTISSASRSSIMMMRSTAGDPDTAVRLISVVVEIASEELVDRQAVAGIAPESFIGVQVLSAPAVSGVANDTALRVQAVILGVGAVGGVTLAVLFDDVVGMVRRYRARRREAKAAVKEAEAKDAGADEVGEPDGSPAEDGEDRAQSESTPESDVFVADQGDAETAGSAHYADNDDPADPISPAAIDEPEPADGARVRARRVRA